MVQRIVRGEVVLKYQVLDDPELQRELRRGQLQRGDTPMVEIGLSAGGAGTSLSHSLGQKMGAGIACSIGTR